MQTLTIPQWTRKARAEVMRQWAEEQRRADARAQSDRELEIKRELGLAAIPDELAGLIPNQEIVFHHGQWKPIL